MLRSKFNSRKWFHGLLKVVVLTAVLIVVLTLNSCIVHEFPDETKAPRYPVKVHLNFNYEMPPYKEVLYENGTLTSRHDGDAMQMDARYIVGFYRTANARGDYSRAPDDMVVLSKEDISNLNHDFSIDLPTGTQKIMVWTDYVPHGTTDHYHYNADDFSSITLKTPHRGNDDYRDAFRGTIVEKLGPHGVDEITVEMHRPMAKYKFVAVDFDEFHTRAVEAARAEASRNGETLDDDYPVNLDEYKVRFHYTGFMPHVYNMFTDKPTDAATGISFPGYIHSIGDGKAELGFDYVFVNGDESLVTANVEIYDKNDKLISSSVPINIPLKRSMLTLVNGKFLTSEAQGGVGINPDFDGEINIVIP